MSDYLYRMWHRLQLLFGTGEPEEKAPSTSNFRRIPSKANLETCLNDRLDRGEFSEHWMRKMRTLFVHLDRDSDQSLTDCDLRHLTSTMAGPALPPTVREEVCRRRLSEAREFFLGVSDEQQAAAARLSQQQFIRLMKRWLRDEERRRVFYEYCLNNINGALTAQGLADQEYITASQYELVLKMFYGPEADVRHPVQLMFSKSGGRMRLEPFRRAVLGFYFDQDEAPGSYVIGHLVD